MPEGAEIVKIENWKPMKSTILGRGLGLNYFAGCYLFQRGCSGVRAVGLQDGVMPIEDHHRGGVVHSSGRVFRMIFKFAFSSEEPAEALGFAPLSSGLTVWTGA